MKKWVKNLAPGLLAALLVSGLVWGGPTLMRRNVLSRSGDTEVGTLTFTTATNGIDLQNILLDSTGNVDIGDSIDVTGTVAATGTGAGFTSAAASGTNGFACTTNGCRFDLGSGASDYASSDGTTVTFAGALTTSGAFTAGNVNVTGSTIPTRGIYTGPSNSTGLSQAGAAAFTFTSPGVMTGGNSSSATLLMDADTGVRLQWGTTNILCNGTDCRINGTAGLGVTGSIFTGNSTTLTFNIVGALAAATASSTVAAVTVAPSATYDANDLVFNVLAVSAGSSILSVDLEGDGRFGGDLLLAGNDLTGTAADATFNVVSAITAAAAGLTVGAVTVAPSATLDLNDLVFNVLAVSAGSSILSVDLEGDGRFGGDLALAGNGLTGTAADATFTITSNANDTLTSASVAAITLAASVDITDADLIFEINNSAGGSVLALTEAGTLTLALPLPIASGGTAKALTLAAGAVVWTDADSFEVTAAGTSGQCLKSGGTGTPTWGACEATATTSYAFGGYSSIATLAANIDFAVHRAHVAGTSRRACFVTNTVGTGAAQTVLLTLYDRTAAANNCTLSIACDAVADAVTCGDCSTATVGANDYGIRWTTDGCTTRPLGNAEFTISQP